MHLPNQKGLIHIPVLVILLIVVSATAILITQNPNPDTKGVMIAHQGEDDGDRSGSGSSGSGSSGSSGSSESKNEDKNDEQKIETKTETKFSEEEKIKTEVKDGRQRIDVYSGGVKVRYETRDGRTTIKAETEEGEGVPEQELSKIKIATVSSNFPLQVDLNTNQLIVTTPAGTKVVTVLPDQAVQNMLAANVISRLGAPAIREATSAAQVIQLGLKNNIPVYEIPGIKQFNLLGFIPVDRPVTAVVSAETGELVNTNQSFLTQIIDLLSP